MEVDMRFPCEIGEVLYYADKRSRRPERCTVTRFIVAEYGIEICCAERGGLCYLKDFDKYLSRTMEECVDKMLRLRDVWDD